jgi:hypothetical protein
MDDGGTCIEFRGENMMLPNKYSQNLSLLKMGYVTKILDLMGHGRLVQLVHWRD